MIPKTSKKHVWALPLSFVVSLILELSNFLNWNTMYFHDEIFGWEFTVMPFWGQLIICFLISLLLSSFYEIMQTRKQTENVPISDKIADVTVSVIFSALGFLTLKTLFLFL